jgi:hypothetical protein
MRSRSCLRSCLWVTLVGSLLSACPKSDNTVGRVVTDARDTNLETGVSTGASKLETGVDRAALVAAVTPQVVQFIRSTQPDAAADTIQLGRPWGEFDVHKGLRLVFRGSWRVLASMSGDYFAVVDVARDGDSYKMTAIGSAQFVATLSVRESLPTVSAALDRAQVGLLRCFGEGGDSLLAYQEAEVTQAASQSEIRVQPLSLSDPRFRGLDAGVGELLERSLEEIDPLFPDE